MKNSNSTHKFFELYPFSPTFAPTTKLVTDIWITGTWKKAFRTKNHFADYSLRDRVSSDDGQFLSTIIVDIFS